MLTFVFLCKISLHIVTSCLPSSKPPFILGLRPLDRRLISLILSAPRLSSSSSAAAAANLAFALAKKALVTQRPFCFRRRRRYDRRESVRCHTMQHPSHTCNFFETNNFAFLKYHLYMIMNFFCFKTQEKISSISIQVANKLIRKLDMFLLNVSSNFQAYTINCKYVHQLQVENF